MFNGVGRWWVFLHVKVHHQLLVYLNVYLEVIRLVSTDKVVSQLSPLFPLARRPTISEQELLQGAVSRAVEVYRVYGE